MPPTFWCQGSHPAANCMHLCRSILIASAHGLPKLPSRTLTDRTLVLNRYLQDYEADATTSAKAFSIWLQADCVRAA